MLSSKYSNLPDIDTAADVYESEDVAFGTGAESDPYAEDLDLFPIASTSKSQSTNPPGAGVDQSHLPKRDVVVGVYGKSARKNDSSYSYRPPRIRIPRRNRALQTDDSSSSDESLETPQAKLRRLKYEMEELERDLKSSRAGEEKADWEGMMKQLEVLKSGMGGLEVEVGKEREIDKSGELMRKLEGVGMRRENEELDVGKVEKVSMNVGGADDLDKRLATLESVIGAGGGSDEVHTHQPIIPTLTKLEQLISILSQPRQLDTISRRIKLLLADLDKAAAASQAAAKRGQTGGEEVKSVLELEEKEKVDALFVLVGRINPILPVVSPLLMRLRSLSALHASAAGFDTMLRQLESKMDGLGDGDMEEVVMRVEKGLKTQSEAVTANWSSLEERLNDVERRLKDVQG